MGRNVPLWLVLLCLFLFSLAAVGFGWKVKLGALNANAGLLSRVSVEIASFPNTVQKVIQETTDYLSGDYKDKFVRVARDKNANYDAFVPIRTAPGIDVKGLVMRADQTALVKGWRLLIGAFTVSGEAENAALLLSPQLEIVKVWILDEIAADGFEPQPKHRKLVHGLAFLDDASLVYTFTGSVSLQRLDRCGKRLWATGGKFHHSVTPDDRGESVWTFGSQDSIAQVAIENGEVIRRITVDDIIAANPMTDILEVRRLHRNDPSGNGRNTSGRWLADQFHFNDVDPLPASIADRFDGFAAGDLLISARSLNLVFVLDPKTLKIKWWRIGAVQRQHDPDWLPSGEIGVLNNRMSRDFSEISAIDPATFKTRTLYDGRRNDFYTRIRGKHQLLPSGHIAIASAQQGRVFEIDRAGNTVLEIANLKPGSETYNYIITELKWLPVSSFDLGNDKCANTN